ncbi:MAG TPA: rRNA cytosine-C5-methylase, partial [Acetobacteraceae bacterium]|nr:rRNA cytosine-C5-methylase [Acetobacteraceae bacterium]
MTPAARIAAAIELLDLVLIASRPADAVANDFFRARRFIGSGDRRAVSGRVWQVLRTRRRLGWWLDRQGAPVTARLLAGASLLLEGWSLPGLTEAYAGGRFGPPPLGQTELQALRPLEGQPLDHPDMPEAVRLELPDWLLPPLRTRFGAELAAELAALGKAAPLDLRTNLL